MGSDSCAGASRETGNWRVECAGRSRNRHQEHVCRERAYYAASSERRVKPRARCSLRDHSGTRLSHRGITSSILPLLVEDDMTRQGVRALQSTRPAGSGYRLAEPPVDLLIDIHPCRPSGIPADERDVFHVRVSVVVLRICCRRWFCRAATVRERWRKG